MWARDVTCGQVSLEVRRGYRISSNSGLWSFARTVCAPNHWAISLAPWGKTYTSKKQIFQDYNDVWEKTTELWAAVDSLASSKEMRTIVAADILGSSLISRNPLRACFTPFPFILESCLWSPAWSCPKHKQNKTKQTKKHLALWHMPLLPANWR